MPMIFVNGTRLHVASTGSGDDVVMVHGLAANLAFWRLKIVPYLVAQYRITAYDLRGHGRSAMPANGYSPSTMAEDLKGVLDAGGIEAAHLVGHSFGGAVVMEFAARYPERVLTLTLADATVYSLQPLDQNRDWDHWHSWRKTLMELGIEVPDKLPKVAFAMLEELADPRWRKARQGWRRGRRRPPGEDVFVPFGLWNGAKRTAARWIQLLRTTDAWQELQSDGLDLEGIRRISHPTLLMYGERSRWMRTCEALGEAMVNSRTVILPKVGHFFPLLNPTGFVLHLRQFLDRDRDLRAEMVNTRRAPSTAHDAVVEGVGRKGEPARPAAGNEVAGKKAGPNPAARRRHDERLREGQDSG
jgi:pimeloyl-ACP methyl ester carboxylesterase